MSDNPMSNIPERITAPPEMLEPAVAELLRRIPETWEEYQPDDLTETQSQALFLLTAAGMVERRERLRLRMLNHSVVAQATITFTGEEGGMKALEPLLANMWVEWQDTFREWKRSEAASVPSAHCERLEPSEWRLTDLGVAARRDLDRSKQDQSIVFDFVLKRGFFDGTPKLMPGGRISSREPVRGKGALVKMEKIRADATPETVDIGNWKEGGDAFAEAFNPVIAKLFEAMQAQADGGTDKTTAAEDATSKSPRGRRRLSQKEAERRLNILEAWERARDAVSREDFCDDNNITVKKLEAYQAWASQRRNRGQ